MKSRIHNTKMTSLSEMSSFAFQLPPLREFVFNELERMPEILRLYFTNAAVMFFDNTVSVTV